MLEEDFCALLERKLENALARYDGAPVCHFSCDGILPPTFAHDYSPAFVHQHKKVSMTAFVGPDGQDEYELILHFGPTALSRYARELDLFECIPDELDSSSFDIDISVRKIWIQLI